MFDKKIIFIIGVQKCGTTTLFTTLNRSHSIAGSTIKEPHFLALKNNIIKSNLNWYENLFNKSEKNTYLMEASTSYFFNKSALKFIKKRFNNYKILVILRDPSKRTYSSFWHMKKKGGGIEKRNFTDILSYFCNDDLKHAEEQALQAAVTENLINANYFGVDYLRKRLGAPFDSKFEDPYWPFRYFSNSVYSDHIIYLKESFKDNLKIIFLEELINDTRTVILNLTKFLNINEQMVFMKLGFENKTLVPKNKIIDFLSHQSKKFLDSNPSFNFLREFIFKISRNFYKSRKKITISEYWKARYVLRHEYEYWFSTKPNLKKYWTY